MIWFLASLPWLYAAAAVVRIFVDDKRETSARRAQIAAREAYYAERDPHCDGCAAKDGKEPIAPVIRCVKCMACVAGLVGDPLFGFDFAKHREGK